VVQSLARMKKLFRICGCGIVMVDDARFLHMANFVSGSVSSFGASHRLLGCCMFSRLDSFCSFWLLYVCGFAIEWRDIQAYIELEAKMK